MRLAEDQDMYYRLEEVGATRWVNQPLYRYRRHSGSISIGNRTAAAFAHHLMAMAAALQRRRVLLSKGAWEFQRRAVLQHYTEFVEWGGTHIGWSGGTCATVHAGLAPVATIVSLPGRAVRYRVKRLLAEFRRGR
jgi:hypothetical protein